ncbi:MAG: ATP-dependent DNA helicase RecG [Dehalococcoidales bacterium]|nr:ATP-dependent DNA helicase RecG [Dehalococcoidales bacterium]
MDFGDLRKILALEEKLGFGDSAVLGGMDRFLRNFATSAEVRLNSPELIRRFRGLFGSSYSAMTVPQRKAWVAEVTSFLDEVERGKTRVASVPQASGAVPVRDGAAATKKISAKRKKAVNIVAASPPLYAPLTVVSGISTALAQRFARLGLRTVRDLLYFFPHRHIDYSRLKLISQLVEGEEQTIVANIWQAQEVNLGGRRSTEAIVGDETGNIRVVWFNQPYLAKRLRTNDRIILSGRVSVFRGRLVFLSPEWEPVDETETVHTARLVPVYSLTEGLRPRQVRRLMKDFIDRWAEMMPEFLPQDLRSRLGLLELSEAIRQAHFPDGAARKDQARRRLAFDELFLLQLGVMSRKRTWQEGFPAEPLAADPGLLERFLSSLPFRLTSAQRRVLDEILADMRRSSPMSRLLQGEVGSGKTVVATAALLTAVASGFQGALMAPTEILAQQHFNTLAQLLSRVGDRKGEGYLYTYTGILPRRVSVALLIGEVPAAQKRELHRRIAGGDIDIAVGTHALLQKDVGFARLGLAVVDEQHRFGVAQRSALREKGFSPHMLVMTATPIPRTLALTIYGDLDLSVIDELPPGRQPVKTKWLSPEQRESAYAFIRRQVAKGRQAFILCPLIEESEAIAAQAATAEYERLTREVFPDLRLGLLHGRLSAEAKEKVMRDFRDGRLDILVATPVIEVGIDIPNATVMLIESADRFGLSQLHQLRGRVGRGSEPGYCLLLAESPSEVAQKRLDIIENVHDGFRLAEEDLKMRGPGEFFGTRQSGLPDLRMARLSDVPLLELARTEATRLFQLDPALTEPGHRLLREELDRIWKGAAEWS